MCPFLDRDTNFEHTILTSVVKETYTVNLHPGKDYFISTPRIFIPVFFTENEIKSASFLDASMFDPMFQSESGKLCHSVKPCLEYDDVTGIQFYCASK